MSDMTAIPYVAGAEEPPAPSAAPGASAAPARKPKNTSPTQRTLKYWRDQGYTCAIVERWNPHARIRQDLYGFIDVLAIKGEDIVGIQACSGAGGDSAARVRKITEHANYPLVCRALTIVVQSWRKNAKGRWVSREVQL